MRVIAIDIGATFVKGAFFDNAEPLDIVREISPTNFAPKENKHQVDPNLFITIVTSIIDKLIKKFGYADYILSSTQMHGFVIVDKNLEAISKFHSWMDQSSESTYICKKNAINYFTEIIDESLIFRTGMPISAFLPNINIPCFFQSNKDTNNADNSFMNIGDYVFSKLLGQSSNYTSISNAAASGLYDLELMDWNYPLIETLEIKLSLPIVNSGLEKPWGKYKGMEVMSPIGDQQAALNAVWDSNYENVCISNIATGSQVTTVSNELKLSLNFQSRPFVDKAYIRTIPFIPAGRSLNVLIRFFQEVIVNLGGFSDFDERKIWEKTKSILNTCKPNSNQELKIDGDFIGAFSNKGGKITGINEENLTVNFLLMGFIENLVSKHTSSITKIMSKPLETLILTGGLPHQFPIIKKTFECKLDNIVTLSNTYEDALFGLNKLVLNKTKYW